MARKKLILLFLMLFITIVFAACSSKEASDVNVFYGTAEINNINISAEAAGTIKKINVIEGEHINAGTIVALLDIPENEIKLEQSELTVQSAENELSKVQKGSRSEEVNAQKAAVKQAEAYVKQIEAALNQASAALKLAENSVNQAQNNIDAAQNVYAANKEKYDELNAKYQDNLVSREELDNMKNALDSSMYALNNAKYAKSSNELQVKSAQAQYNSVASQLDGAKAQLAAVNEKLELLQNGATAENINAAQYSVRQAKTNNELTQIMNQKQNVTANVDGTVEVINYNAGEYVTPGTPVITMVDASNMWVKIFVPERLLPQLNVDQKVEIRCDNLPDINIKGKILYIASEAEFTPANIVTKEERNRLVFEVKVKILDNTDKIRPGMLLDIYIE